MMTSVQDRLMKRDTLDKWSIREQLCLASAVSRCGDQNWVAVSRALKPFSDPQRPADWFHQKNCALQYSMLLGNADVPKRKKRSSGTDTPLDISPESILRRLSAERQTELKKVLAEERAEYRKLQEDMAILQSGKVSEEQLDKWCKEIEQEENLKEQESTAYAQWLKEREQRKQEVVWRSNKPVPIAGIKHKNSDSLDSLIETEHVDEVPQQHQHQTYPQTPEASKLAPSPLLTSLLKSPSQVQNTSMLHTAITNRHPTPSTNTNPMIASLLNSSTGVTVSPGLQQLVSTAIGQEANIEEEQQQPIGNDILDDPNMPNIKIDDLANSILVQDGPLPEIKKEEVDDIISEIIENAHDIVSDPEQHLQLDGNGDININLGLEDFDEDDEEIIQEVVESKEHSQEVTKTKEKLSTPVVDPFEFQEDPVIHLESSVKVSNMNKQDSKQYVPHYQQQTQMHQQQEPQQQQQFQQQHQSQQQQLQLHQESLPQVGAEKISEGNEETTIEETKNDEVKDEIQEVKEENLDQELIEKQEESEVVKIMEEPPTDTIKMEDTAVPGSVEIVEVVGTEEEEIDKELNKSQIQDIVHSIKSTDSEEVKSSPTEIYEEKIKTETEESSPIDSKDTVSITTCEESSEASDLTADNKKEVPSNLEGQDAAETTTHTSDFTEGLYDEMNMEVKIDKSGKAKRDYSRTKKKEEKGFDMLLAIEKAQLEDSELTEGTLLENTMDNDKKDIKLKVKSDNDRSNSPWTEEDDNALRSKRRYSTPATPNDSIPNSPASSSAFYYEDDKDYRNWKKSVMLVYNRLATNKYASLFLKHITDDQAPGYSSTVYRPMDLQTIKKNIENGTIRTTLEFKRDTMLMFTNALMYNRTNETIYNMALQMQQESLEPIQILMSAESHNDDTPLRRETRTSESGTKRKRTITDETLLKTKKRKED
ncbi:bromodomain containing 8 [Leptinotarsa decemlineata]|uniref:bromodomain containing 8 n=1 Tax=Leptinotarsa decemlineata TaxID=7539 RepID=UPI003D30D7A2